MQGMWFLGILLLTSGFLYGMDGYLTQSDIQRKKYHQEALLREAQTYENRAYMLRRKAYALQRRIDRTLHKQRYKDVLRAIELRDIFLAIQQLNDESE